MEKHKSNVMVLCDKIPVAVRWVRDKANLVNSAIWEALPSSASQVVNNVFAFASGSSLNNRLIALIVFISLVGVIYYLLPYEIIEEEPVKRRKGRKSK